MRPATARPQFRLDKSWGQGRGEFDSGVIGKDQSFSQVFDTVGSIDYHCDIHPNMVGKITVKLGGSKTHTIEITTMAFPDNTPIGVGDTVV
jgi:hypothetical protein